MTHPEREDERRRHVRAGAVMLEALLDSGIGEHVLVDEELVGRVFTSLVLHGVTWQRLRDTLAEGESRSVLE